MSVLPNSEDCNVIMETICVAVASAGKKFISPVLAEDLGCLAFSQNVQSQIAIAQITGKEKYANGLKTPRGATFITMIAWRHVAVITMLKKPEEKTESMMLLWIKPAIQETTAPVAEGGSKTAEDSIVMCTNMQAGAALMEAALTKVQIGAQDSQSLGKESGKKVNAKSLNGVGDGGLLKNIAMKTDKMLVFAAAILGSKIGIHIIVEALTMANATITRFLTMIKEFLSRAIVGMTAEVSAVLYMN